MLADKISQLEVSIDGTASGQLIKRSIYEFRYLDPRLDQAAVALLMPASAQATWQDGDLFPIMDQNLPEGDLFARLRALFPKQPTTPMHLLALIGANGIGRLGYRLPDAPSPSRAPPMTREALLKTAFTPQVFDELVRAYLNTGAGIAGMQPKIMVPDRSTAPIPSLIVKAAGPAYPGLAANEYLCLKAAQRAGIGTPTFDLSDDGLRVRDVLSDRKYQGSYQRVAEMLKQLQLPRENLHRFFEQVAFTVMVRNGDGHLKNYGVLYRSPGEAWLAPMFDVVTTSIYRYTRYDGGPELEDRTLALKLFAGRHQTKAYPTTEELIAFGRKVCELGQPGDVLQRIATAMDAVLLEARSDPRIPGELLGRMEAAWHSGMAYASKAGDR